MILKVVYEYVTIHYMELSSLKNSRTNSLMKTVIVGLGYFGSIIKSKLSEESVTVDLYNENATYKSIDDVPFNDGKWFAYFCRQKN